MRTPFAFMTNRADGPCPNSLLTMKVETSLICLVDTQILTVSMIK